MKTNAKYFMEKEYFIVILDSGEHYLSCIYDYVPMQLGTLVNKQGRCKVDIRNIEQYCGDTFCFPIPIERRVDQIHFDNLITAREITHPDMLSQD